ncbi:MAG: hypothetical protein IT383_25135 [Deltaproteobacteria bacterium]|nr:hypothetical protein [Deltaproteobacteria bacterium]
MKLVALACLVLLIAPAAVAGEVEILVVGDSKPYAEAARAAAQALGTGTQPTTLAAAAPLPAAWSLEPPRAIIAVGARAVRLALKLPGTKVVAAMVLQETAELQNPRAVAVPLAVPVERQLVLLGKLAPHARRVGVVIDPRHSAAAVAEARAEAGKHKLELVVREVASDAEVSVAFAQLLPQVDAVLLVADTTVVKREVIELLVERSRALRVPVIGYSAAVVQAGLLAGYAVEPTENGAVAAMVARALLTDQGPSEAKVRGRLHLNLGTARAIGVVVPADLTTAPTQVYPQR